MDRFRKNYTPINESQKALGLAIKEKAEELLELIGSAHRGSTVISSEDMEDPEKARKFHAAGEANACLRIATTRLEECVMWACKGVFTETL